MLETTKEFKKAIKKEYLEECEYNIKNIGWTLGNTCPCSCKHCYSASVRKKKYSCICQVKIRSNDH